MSTFGTLNNKPQQLNRERAHGLLRRYVSGFHCYIATTVSLAHSPMSGLCV